MGQRVPARHDRGQREPVSFTGRRVVWLGPSQHGTAPAYWSAPDAGSRGLRPEERTRLDPGDLGTVGELLHVSELGHWYVLRFDGGHELETVLPAPNLVQLDPPLATTPVRAAKPSATTPARRYAAARADGGLLGVWRRMWRPGPE